MTDASSPPATPQAEQDSSTSGTQEKAQEVAGKAQEKAQETAQQAQSMVREQVDQRSTQAAERVTATAGDLRSVSDELRNQGKDTPAKLADQAAEKTERLGSYLSESSPEKLLEDAEEFGRRQPLAVLAGGLAVGLLAARFLKASSGDRYRQRTQSSERTSEIAVPARPPQPPPPPVESTIPAPHPAAVGSTP
jgi:glucan phosphorylase